MPRSRRSIHAVLLAALLAGCVPAPNAKPVPATRKSATPTAPGASPGAPTAPIATGGGSIVSNNSSSLIGKVKAPASLISDKGNGLVSNNGGNYALLAAPEQVPLAGATVRLLDAAGAPIQGTDGKALTAVTDAEGNYGFQTALPTQNLVVEVALADAKGAVRAVVPREGTGRKTVEVDLVSTLTTGYILDRFVRTQADPLATFEKLPAEVEAATRQKAQTALVGGAAAVPDALTDARVVETVDALRAKDASFNDQMETVEKLLVVAGASDLGSGLKATEVTIQSVDDLEIGPDGTMYVLTTADNRVWRVRPDGVIEVAVGDRRPPSGQDLTGELGIEASLKRPTGLGLDPDGRLVMSEDTGVYKLGADGKLERVTSKTGAELAAGKDDEVILAAVEPIANYAEQGYPEALAPKVYAFYRCKPGTAPVRIHEIAQDPNDDGSQTVFLRGLAWDGGEALYLNIFNNGANHQLLKLDLTSKAATVESETASGARMLDGAGHVFDWATGGQARVRSLFTRTADQTVPAPPEHTSRLVLAPDGRAYAAKWGMVFRLDAAGAVRVAGTEGQAPSGNAGEFTFEVLSTSTVTPEGVVYAIDTGKGAVYKVTADRQISSLSDTGRGNVQILRSDPAGTIYMSDGNGTGIGKFDARGVWTQLGTTSGMIVDYAVAADGTVYASTATLSGERHYKVVAIKNGVETVLETGLAGARLAVDRSGVLHVVGGGALKRREGSTWKTLKSDDRFSNLYTLGGGPELAFDAQGRLYMTRPDENKIIRYSPAEDLFQSIAGLGTRHFAGTGTDDSLSKPRSPAFDAAGNLYFSDTGNRQVKRIAAEEL